MYVASLTSPCTWVRVHGPHYGQVYVFLFSDDALVEELTKQLSPRLIIASDEIRMLDIALGQGTTPDTQYTKMALLCDKVKE